MKSHPELFDPSRLQEFASRMDDVLSSFADVILLLSGRSVEMSSMQAIHHHVDLLSSGWVDVELFLQESASAIEVGMASLKTAAGRADSSIVGLKSSRDRLHHALELMETELDSIRAENKYHLRELSEHRASITPQPDLMPSLGNGNDDEVNALRESLIVAMKSVRRHEGNLETARNHIREQEETISKLTALHNSRDSPPSDDSVEEESPRSRKRVRRESIVPEDTRKKNALNSFFDGLLGRGKAVVRQGQGLISRISSQADQLERQMGLQGYHRGL